MLKGSLPLRELLGSLLNGSHLRGRTRAVVRGGQNSGAQSILLRHKVTALQEQRLDEGATAVAHRQDEAPSTTSNPLQTQVLAEDAAVVEPQSGAADTSPAPQAPSSGKGFEVS